MGKDKNVLPGVIPTKKTNQENQNSGFFKTLLRRPTPGTQPPSSKAENDIDAQALDETSTREQDSLEVRESGMFGSGKGREPINPPIQIQKSPIGEEKVIPQIKEEKTLNLPEVEKPAEVKVSYLTDSQFDKLIKEPTFIKQMIFQIISSEKLFKQIINEVAAEIFDPLEKLISEKYYFIPNQDYKDTIKEFNILQNNIKECESIITEKNNEISIIEEVIENKNTTVNTLNEQISQNESRVNTLNGYIESSREELSQIESKVETAKSSFQKMEEEHKSAIENQTKVLIEKSNELNSDLETKINEYKALTAVIPELVSKVTDKAAESLQAVTKELQASITDTIKEGITMVTKAK